MQSHAYFDHDADIGVIARGGTVEEAFEAAAKATFGIVTDLDRVQPTAVLHVEFEEADLELALITWLNLLLAKAREYNSVYSTFRIRREGTRWVGEAHGEPWGRHLEPGVEVKGATLTALSVREVDGVWEARCIVDV
jgi:SHS2 domain-containing protein